MFDLLAIALQADLTRVFTFMVAREVSQRTYPALGVTEPHHAVSHHGNRPESIEHHAKVNTYHMTLFSEFVTYAYARFELRCLRPLIESATNVSLL